jgi:hypothetical protein
LVLICGAAESVVVLMDQRSTPQGELGQLANVPGEGQLRLNPPSLLLDWHVPARQVVAPVHTWQVTPAKPQAELLVPAWQAPVESTHPVHDDTHWLLVHCAVPVHVWQVTPPVPQSALVVPP